MKYQSTTVNRKFSQCLIPIIFFSLFSSATVAETEPCETAKTETVQKEETITKAVNNEASQKSEMIDLSIDCSQAGPIHYTKVSFVKDGKSEINMKSCEQYIGILSDKLSQVPAEWEHFNASLANSFKEKQCGSKYWCQLGTANLCHMKAPFRFERGFNSVKELHDNVIKGLTQSGWCK